MQSETIPLPFFFFFHPSSLWSPFTTWETSNFDLDPFPPNSFFVSGSVPPRRDVSPRRHLQPSQKFTGQCDVRCVTAGKSRGRPNYFWPSLAGFTSNKQGVDAELTLERCFLCQTSDLSALADRGRADFFDNTNVSLAAAVKPGTRLRSPAEFRYFHISMTYKNRRYAGITPAIRHLWPAACHPLYSSDSSLSRWRGNCGLFLWRITSLFAINPHSSELRVQFSRRRHRRLELLNLRAFRRKKKEEEEEPQTHELNLDFFRLTSQRAIPASLK